MKAIGDIRPLEWSDRRLLLSLLGLAFLLRLCVVPIIGIHHFDELWQYLEPAYKIVTGRWVETWDFREGIRSWLVPMAVAPAVWLGLTLDPDGLMHVYLPRVEMALLSLTIIWSAWKLGLRISRLHAAMAALIAATWVEFVHFGPRTMSEPIAVALLFPAFVLITEDGRSKWALGGLLLGLAVMVRLQYAPAAALLALGGIWNRWDRLPWVIAGGTIGFAIDGFSDFLAGEPPFHWITQNFSINFLQGRSADFGTSPWYEYLLDLLYYWKFAAGFIIVLAGVGARRFPILMIVAVANIIVHSLIAHKEYRFIFLSSAILVFLAAIGTADALKLTVARRPALTKLAIAVWLMSSGFLALVDPIRSDLRNLAPLLTSLRIAGNSSSACGLATYGLRNEPAAAYSFYNRETPIYTFKGENAREDFLANSSRFNIVIARRASGSVIGSGYRLDRCADPTGSKLCIYRRKGGCTASVERDSDVNRVWSQ